MGECDSHDRSSPPGSRAIPTPTRREQILSLTDLERGPGLEIAPLHRPIALKSEWDVRYVDITTTERLREHYADEASVPVEDIMEVDFPLTGPDGEIRRLAEVAKGDSPYAWVIASHVIEHVPDLITWLDDIATLLQDEGSLVLVVPDTRYSFDAYRPQTTVGQMLQAAHQGDTVPSVRAVYDHFSTASEITTQEAWSGNDPGLDASRGHTEEETLTRLESAKAGEYIDCHVWTFRPSTFIDQINELGRLGLCDFVVETLRNTRPDDLEFFAVLRRLPRNRTTEEDTERRRRAKKKTNDSPERFRPPPPSTAVELSESERRLVERRRAVVRRTRRLLRRSR